MLGAIEYGLCRSPMQDIGWALPILLQDEPYPQYTLLLLQDSSSLQILNKDLIGLLDIFPAGDWISQFGLG